MLVRQIGWRRRLDLFLLERLRMPFIYGSNDCAVFACDGVRALTGTDMAARFRGEYRDEIGAALMMKRECGTSDIRALADFMARKYELPEVQEMVHVRYGDLAIHLVEARPTLGIVVDRRTASPGVDGLVYRPTIDALTIWSI